MGRGRVLIAGREKALAALVSASQTSARRGKLVVVRGAGGIGKTRLLAAAAQRLRADGRFLQVHVDGKRSSQRCGADEILRVLREDFATLGDVGLVDRIGALARLQERDQFGGAAQVSAMSAELWTIFGSIGARSPLLVTVDDADEIVDVAALLVAARRPGCLVVAAALDGPAASPVAAELAALADQVIDLGLLAEEDVVLAAGDGLSEDIHAALRSALGPLYGNPGAVLATIEDLRTRGLLRDTKDGVVLGDSAKSVRLAGDDHVLRRVRNLGKLGERMLTAVAAAGTLDADAVPRLAALLGEDVAECGRSLDELVEAGALVCAGLGRVACLCPALAISATASDPGLVRQVRDAFGQAVPGAGPERPSLRSVVRTAAAAAEENSSRHRSAADIRLVELISSGFTNRRIASVMGVSEKTVESRLTRLFAKTGCRSRAELVATGLHGGFPRRAAKMSSAAAA